MTAAAAARTHEISRLKREITYYCGVAGRTHSRERLQSAHALIRQREQQLLQALQAQSKSGGRDD